MALYLGETRTDLYDALTTALSATRVRVTKYPPKPGALSRYDALVTIGNVGTSTEYVGMVTVGLDVQVGIGDIETAFETMDEVLQDVDAALPVQFEAANWVTTVDDSDQPVLRSVAELVGHSSPAPALGELLLINDSGDAVTINDSGDVMEIN